MIRINLLKSRGPMSAILRMSHRELLEIDARSEAFVRFCIRMRLRGAGFDLSREYWSMEDSYRGGVIYWQRRK